MCNTPEDLDLKNVDTVAVDIETYDPNLKTKGLGAIRNDGFICGIAVATKTLHIFLYNILTLILILKKLKKFGMF